MSGPRVASLLAIAQSVLAIRLVIRLVRTAGGSRIARISTPAPHNERVTVLIPVLNERHRLEPCLRGVLAQGDEVAEILVIDGGSTDGTQELVRAHASDDARLCLLDASPVPVGVNGKSHGLEIGLRHRATNAGWILTLDADVFPDPDLVRSLLAHAHREGVPALSVATLQRLTGVAEGLVHPAMLATLVYRFGIPGIATSHVGAVQANGQCFLVDASVLHAVGGFSSVLHAVAEDVTLARIIARAGFPIGFYESDGLISVRMYAGWRDTWDNWSRSLPMRDDFTRRTFDLEMLALLLVESLPPWLALISYRRRPHGRFQSVFSVFRVNLALVFLRAGILLGMARAYETPPWSYWLSPLVDLPVTLRLWSMSRRTTHRWRGRIFTTGGDR